MFNDLFHLVLLLDHDYREENGERFHAYTCRRCEISLRLKSFRANIRRLLHEMDFDIGDPEAENKKEAESPRMDQR